MKKLSILVPQYKETFDVIKPLLDSIAIQQDIDFNDIEVVIVNDGSDVILDTKEFERYNFDVRYIIRKQNKGVSYTRNQLLKESKGEYIIYCDADDMFFNVMGLYLILKQCQIGFDIFSSTFIEENRVNNEPAFVIRQDNRTFVHGKVLRKQYLIDNEITWNNDMKIHEDYYFFAQAFCLTNSIKYCPEYFYLWKWREDSVCRKEKDFLYKTYYICIQHHTCLIKELLRKKAEEQAEYYVTKLLYEIFSMINTKEWLDRPEHRETTLKAIAEYYKEFKPLYKKSKDKDIFIQQQKIDTKKFAKFLRDLEKIAK